MRYADAASPGLLLRKRSRAPDGAETAGVIFMEKAYQGARRLFAVGFALAAAAVLLHTGWTLPLLIGAGVWALTREPAPRFTRRLFVGAFALRVAILLLLHPPIESDFRMLYDAARGVLAGDFSFQNTVYFSLWGYQSPFVAWEAFWLLLWDSPYCLKLVNAALAAGISCLLYRLARERAGRRAAQRAALLLELLPFSAVFHTVLSNQIPSAFFLTLGVWLLACGDCDRLGFLRYPLAGLAMQAGNLLRSEGVIVLTATLAWAAFWMLKRPKEARRLLAGLAALFAVYFAAHAGADALVRGSGLCRYGLENRDPAWKVVLGVNPEFRGGYSDEDWDLVGPTLDEERQPTAETAALQNGLIRERLSVGPTRLALLLWDKIDHLWATAGLQWALGHLEPVWPKLCALARRSDRGMFFLALGLAVYGLPGLRGRRDEPSALLPYFIFFAAFCAFLPIEVQPRYAYLPQLYVFQAAAFGLERLERRETGGEAVDRRALP